MKNRNCQSIFLQVSRQTGTCVQKIIILLFVHYAGTGASRYIRSANQMALEKIPIANKIRALIKFPVFMPISILENKVLKTVSQYDILFLSYNNLTKFECPKELYFFLRLNPLGLI